MLNNSGELLRATQDAEDSLIGSLLIESTKGNREAIEQSIKLCLPTSFYFENDRRLYQAMISCQAPPHQINTANELSTHNNLQTDDCSHMSYCISIVPCSLDYLHYARCVASYSSQRSGNKKIHYRDTI